MDKEQLLSDRRARRAEYTPALTPRLRILLVVVFALAALLGANSVYLVSVTAFESLTGRTFQNFFYQRMFLAHLALGLFLFFPFIVFATLHTKNAWRRKNRRAVRLGYGLFVACLVCFGTGFLLTRVGGFDLKAPVVRGTVYWLHIFCPLMVIALYCMHRYAGPPIRWRLGIWYGGGVVATCVCLLVFHSADPREWYQVGPDDGVKYFEPSLARTASGKFIPAVALQNDQYCRTCHADVHDGWARSAHRFSSFNNPMYLTSVRETREFSTAREGTVRRARWCAGCHDPVPFFSGRFDDPKYDDIHDPTAHAGITCTVCHAITNINSVRGNADFTIEEPLHYPFAYSDHEVLQWLNQQLVKAKPSFHKKTFLKPFHKSAEFCSVCHKVHLPEELNDYKFLRGQNHYDAFLLSGVSGHGARSFYYPEKAHRNCNRCHMPLMASDDFGAKRYDGSNELMVHDHLFLGANTALPYLRGEDKTVRKHQEFLQDCMRVDIFGVRSGGRIDSPLIAPLRPEVPTLEPGQRYLIEAVIRTTALGHVFTQGTADSNEVWLDVVARSGERVIGRSGAIDESGEVDPWSHFVNVFMLDRDGNRIDRRNAQDIFVPLYNHQIPPGAGQTVHFSLDVPHDVSQPIEINLRLQYRKFDQKYFDLIVNRKRPGDQISERMRSSTTGANPFPITTLAVDRLVLPVQGVDHTVSNSPSSIPMWQRWNDYGIGLFLKGKAELRQATEAFEQVAKLGRFDGALNLARVFYREGRLDEAVAAVHKSAQYVAPPAPSWTMAWLSGLVNREQGHLEAAEENFRSVLAEPTAEMRRRRLDFSKDYEVINLLGQTLFDRARSLRGAANQQRREELLRQAEMQFDRTVQLDPENVTAHYNLARIYAQLGDQQRQQTHQQLHAKYRPDDNARDRSVAEARKKYPAANHAAEAVVIYDLSRTVKEMDDEIRDSPKRD